MACHFAMDSMGLANLVPLVASPHRDKGKLAQDDGLSDGSGYLLRALNIQTRMITAVLNSDNSLEPGPPFSLILLLHWQDLRTSSFRDAPRKEPIVSGSLMGRENRQISSRD